MLHTIHGYLPEFRGGTELYVAALCAHLRDLDVDSVVLCGSGAPRAEPMIEIENVEGIQVYRVHRTENFPERWDHGFSPHTEELFEKVLADSSPEIVHVHHWKRLSRNLVTVAAEAGIPSVISFHDTHVTCPNGFRLRDEKLCREELPNPHCYQCVSPSSWQTRKDVEEEMTLHVQDYKRELDLARALLVPSAAHGKLLASLLGRSQEEFQVESLGDLHPLVPEKKSKEDSRGDVLRLGNWGHQDVVKGVHVLLEALAHLESEELERIEVHLYGVPVTDGYEARLHRLAEGKPVYFHGNFRREDLIHARFDVAVLPSVGSESYSYVLNEAFSLGTPILCSSVGALSERVKEGGLTFRVGDPIHLASRIRELLTEPNLLDQLRNGIPARLPSMQDHAERIAAAYTNALMRGAPQVRPSVGFRQNDVLKQMVRQAEQRTYDVVERDAAIDVLRRETWALSGEKLDLGEELRRAQVELAQGQREMEELREETARLEKKLAGGWLSRLGRRLGRKPKGNPGEDSYEGGAG